MVVLENKWLRLIFNENTGFFEILGKDDELKVFSNAFARAVLTSPEDAEITLSTYDANKRTYELQDISDGNGKGKKLIAIHAYDSGLVFRVNVTLYENEPFLLFQSIIHASQEGYKLNFLYPFFLSNAQKGSVDMGSIVAWRLLWQDWQSWSSAQVTPLNKSVKRPWMKVPKIIMYSTKEKGGKGKYLSDNFAAIKNLNTQKFVTFGFVSMRDHLTHIGIEVDYKNDEVITLFARSLGEIPLEKDKDISSEKLILILNGMNAVESLSYYATLTQREMKALSWDPVPIGWCSWYYYFTHVSQEAVLQNSKFLSIHKDLPMEWVQLDDGYFPSRWLNSRIGDWLEVNKRFSNGLEWLANEIKADGFKPGLWLAPFIVSKSSDLYKKHPDWVIRNPKGNPIIVNIPIEWGTFNKIYALDTTHPEVQQWLRDLFKTLVENWGFQFLKLDFIYAAAIEGVRYDNSITRVQAYRKGLEIIRETVGDDIFLLGCGAPLGPSIGLVNGMRVSNDTFFAFNQPFLYWFLNNFFFAGLGEQPSMISALKTDIIRSFMHQKFWLNDPDCLLVRRTRSLLKSHEIEFEMTLMGLSGGIILSSDNLPELEPKDLEHIKFLLPTHKSSAVPIDLFENSPPIYYKLQISPEKILSPYYLVGIFNWTKKEIKVPISVQQLQLPENVVYHVFDFWTKRYFQIDADHENIGHLKKNRVKLLVIRRDDNKPQLIASSFHIAQGNIEITNFEFNSSSNEISIEMTRPGDNQGRLYLYLPPAYREKELISDAPRSNMFRHQDGLITIELRFENAARATVKLEKVQIIKN